MGYLGVALRDADLLPYLLCAAFSRQYPQCVAGYCYIGIIRFLVPALQLHAMMMAVFASIIAPFGGFFASGFKRAFKMKDFGDTIPGHGGVTDRFDCQMMMAIFSYLYYWNFVSKPDLSVGAVMSSVLNLDNSQQIELFTKLGNLLVAEGLLPDEWSPTLQQVLALAASQVEQAQ